MSDILIAKDTYWAGVNDRTTDLFEGLWPIEGVGISYNSYVIRDSKNVLIDLSKAFKTDDFFDQIAGIIDLPKLDYVVVNHMEPDHTGVLKTLKMIAKDIQIICTPKAVPMLKSYYGITDGIKVVEDGEKLNIGSRELQFFHVPFVHWPETMVTYDPSTCVLFSCDAFGGYGALQGTLFDEGCMDMDFYEKEALRYYANIVARFSTPVLSAIKKLGGLDIKTIAPSHGLVWKKNPGRIIELYKKWAEYAATGGEPGVTLLYGTMYGNTEVMMNVVAEGIADGGIHPEIYDVARIHPSYLLPALWKNRGVMIGAPTYEVTLFPYMQQVLEKAALKNIRNKKTAYFGSYGWSKGALKKMQSMTQELNWEMVDAFEFAGGGTREDFKTGYALGKKFAENVKKSGN